MRSRPSPRFDLPGRWLRRFDFESLRERFTQTAGGMMLATVIGLLVGSVVWQPTKRNLELLAGMIFVGIVLIAHPFRALLFTIVLIPYPAYTSVGSTSMLLIVAVGGLALMKSRQLNYHSPFLRKDADLALMGFTLMVVLSMYPQPREFMREAQMMLFGLLSAIILYYLIVYLCQDSTHLWRTVQVFQFVLLTLAVMGIFQWLYPDKALLPEFFSFSRRVAGREEIVRGQIRVTGTFNGQELFAEFLAIGLVLQYILFRHARGIFPKAFWLLGALAMLACLFATATRGALIVLMGGYLYMLAIGGRVIPRFQMLKLVALALALFYLSLEIVGPLVDFMIERIVSIGSEDSSVRSRSAFLMDAIRGIPDSPFLGHGLAVPPDTFAGVSRNIHNLYVTLAYTIGIPGLVAFVWFASSLYRASLSVVNSQRVERSTRELALGLNVALVMFLVDELKIEFTREPLTMHLAFMLMAWQVAVWRVATRERAGEFSEHANS